MIADIYATGDNIMRTELGFSMYVTNDIEKYRYETLLTKEPETIAWLRSFSNYSIFYDIGANIGIYSLVCKILHDSITIVPFEPQRTNIDRLVENMRLNGWRSPGLNVPCAVGDIDSHVLFRPMTNLPGSADGVLYPRQSDRHCYDVPVYRIDSLVHMYGMPEYIKIDVDGNEGSVIRGATDTLHDKRLKSVLIEVSRNKSHIVNDMQSAGFTIDNEFNTMTPHSRERRLVENIDCENIIFTRG
jgi:FkbM family methyltransferase